MSLLRFAFRRIFVILIKDGIFSERMIFALLYPCD